MKKLDKWYLFVIIVISLAFCSTIPLVYIQHQTLQDFKKAQDQNIKIIDELNQDIKEWKIKYEESELIREMSERK